MQTIERGPRAGTHLSEPGGGNTFLSEQVTQDKKLSHDHLIMTTSPRVWAGDIPGEAQFEIMQ